MKDEKMMTVQGKNDELRPSSAINAASELANLRRRQAQFQAIAAQTGELLFVYDLAAGRIEYLLEGDLPIDRQYIFAEDLAAVEVFFEQLSKKPGFYTLNFRYARAGTDYVWYRIQAETQKEEGQPRTALGKVVNIDQAYRETIQLKKAAQRDSLTQLFNKKETQSLIDAYLQGEGQGGTHALMVIDVDDFKAINDYSGHLFGDAVLRKMSACLTTIFRSQDIIGRIGGDEFIVFVKACDDVALLTQRAQKICGIFDQIKQDNGQPYPVSSSVGIAIYPRDGISYERLFQQADLAMYSAKSKGKSCVQWCHRLQD